MIMELNNKLKHSNINLILSVMLFGNELFEKTLYDTWASPRICDSLFCINMYIISGFYMISLQLFLKKIITTWIPNTCGNIFFGKE